MSGCFHCILEIWLILPWIIDGFLFAEERGMLSSMDKVLVGYFRVSSLLDKWVVALKYKLLQSMHKI